MRFGPDPEYREPDPPWVMPPIVKPSAFFTIIKPKENQMSYSFSITANTAGEATQAVSAEFKKVVESQPTHATDRAAVLNAASAFIGMLAKPAEDECITVDIYGSLNWRGEGVYNGANVSVSASLASKPKDRLRPLDLALGPYILGFVEGNQAQMETEK